MHPSLERRRILAAAAPQPTPGLFLDRDGVLIEDCHHLSDPDQVRLCPGALELVRAAHEQDWPVVIVTNQSGISRGLFAWDDYERVNDRVLELLGITAPLAAIYGNGHGPDAPAASWRKPSPAMLIDATNVLNLDLERSILIGDRLSDLKAGATAGVAAVCHVLTGHGEEEREAVQRWGENIVSARTATAGCQDGTGDWLDHGLQVLLLSTLESFPMELLQSQDIATAVPGAIHQARDLSRAQ